VKAAIVERYGGPERVTIAEVPRPAPRADEVLVRVRAAAVTSADARIRGACFPRGFGILGRVAFGVTRPRRTVLGSSFSGHIEAVGVRVQGFSPGDEVCGMAGLALGAHAQQLRVKATRIVRKPASVSHDEAAGVLFGGTTALHFLRDETAISAGSSVLVNGASGAIGTNAVQLAKHLGASVTAVTSTANVGLVSDLGADQVVDYTQRQLAELEERFDVVLDTVGNLSIASGRRLLTQRGVLVLAVANLGETIAARGNVVAGTSPERTADFEHLLTLVGGGSLQVVLDHVYELAEIAEAHRRVDSGHKVGNVLVRP
jgi:NADPH:quinone reductase-like Zn-dependent oxidoreductase